MPAVVTETLIPPSPRPPQLEKLNVNFMTVVVAIGGILAVAGAVFAKPSESKVREIAQDELRRSDLPTSVALLSAATVAIRKESELLTSKVERDSAERREESKVLNAKVDSALLLIAQQSSVGTLRRVKRNLKENKPATDGVIAE